LIQVKSYYVGIPLDGIGFQAHITLGQVPSTMQENLQRFVDLDLDVAITELDINLLGSANATALAQQARDYHSVISACLAIERCVSVVSTSRRTSVIKLNRIIDGVLRPCGASQTTIVGYPMARSCHGMRIKIQNLHFFPLPTPFKGSKLIGCDIFECKFEHTILSLLMLNMIRHHRLEGLQYTEYCGMYIVFEILH
jgi:hypothetical protein